MKLYRWDTDIGEVVAMAANVPAARRQVMAKLSPDDAGRDDLERAIAVAPAIENGPFAVVAWHQ